jgi:hypothetical protein
MAAMRLMADGTPRGLSFFLSLGFFQCNKVSLVLEVFEFGWFFTICHV